MTYVSFDAWMALVNQRLIAKCGMSSEDLPDAPYRDWFEDGMTTTEAVDRAVAWAESF